MSEACHPTLSYAGITTKPGVGKATRMAVSSLRTDPSARTPFP